MSLLHNSNAQSSDACLSRSSTSTSDSSALRQRGVHEASTDDDSSVFTVIGDLDSTPSAMDSQTDLSGSLEQDMSEARLRQIYDEEEIERFLYLFSAYVTEVRIPLAPSVSTEQINTELLASRGSSSLRLPVLPKPPPLPPRPFTRVSEQAISSTPLPPPLPPRPVKLSWSEQTALQYILPRLPPVSQPPPPFALKRLQLTSQRLFLAVVPPYQAFFLSMARLALWKNPQRSGLYCGGFWVLWLYDFLLPALMVRILWEMLSRRFFPYPTLETLQMRRKDSKRAREFGESIQERLSASSIGPKEIFQLFKSYKSAAKSKLKSVAKDPDATPSGNDTCEDETATVLDEDSQEEKDLKRDLLNLLNSLADIHERIKNIFMWRRPAVSKKYAVILAIVFFCTLIIPAQYLAKLIYGTCGILFWHAVPVIAALPPAARARLPAPLSDAPTDADYAIEVIAQRITKGEEIRPPRNRKHRSSSARTSETDPVATESFDTSSTKTQSQTNDGVDWKKWGARVAQGKSLLGEGKQLLSPGQVLRDVPSPQRLLSLTPRALQGEDVHTYPAHHTSAPGLITLTATTLYFTALTSQQAKLIIPCENLCGVKKTGLMKGLLITWIDGEKGRGREMEEKFNWVGNRDELFARLLGPDGARWMRI
ncbi:hypothetical protein AZE42_05107 [Rhizopogon vesiculosus]|uniref:Uncharacterized protein n=1 Tax=Rhizopogon vesiculosus TaxID=180088 RepID=A0A1J8QNQ8_9AGAM|nr:hypothetical protein AZE42_05107 [Rhizopogon vesiculosus]